MTSGNGEGGFRFSFGEEEEGQASASASAANTWPPPSTRLSAFPWIRLTAETMAEWAKTYPPEEPASRTGRKATRQQQLPLPSLAPHHSDNDESCGVPSAIYQTAPELPELTRVPSDDATQDKEEEATAPREARDIIPGKYYGGLKVWSCAPDLARFLAAHAEEWRAKVSPTAATASAPVVAEVGCGQAVPGLVALLLGARKLILQDYNAQVLEVCVKPNLAATLSHPGNAALLSSSSPLGSSPATPMEVKLVHGDWVDLDNDEGGGSSHCDVILGADVTFDTEACTKLCNLLSRWLMPGSGVALIATKVFYFGTNGGSLEFTECAARCGLHVSEASRVDEDGGMRRVILQVTKSV